MTDLEKLLAEIEAHRHDPYGAVQIIDVDVLRLIAALREASRNLKLMKSRECRECAAEWNSEHALSQILAALKGET